MTQRLTVTHPDDGFGVAALDPDQAWLENVRPRDWRNPTPSVRYHIVVIGAGTGGLVTAAIAAGLGARVGLVEWHRLGGDCLNVGCVPSKTIIAEARKWRVARSLGVTDGDVERPFLAAMERMRQVRARISAHDAASRFRGLGVDVYFGHARFTGVDAVEVEQRTLRFRRAVIATGSRPSVPPIPGLDAVQYLTNESVFSLRHRPGTLVVVGGGPIGCELAQAFSLLGTDVTLVEAGPRVLHKDDADAASIVERTLRRDSVDVRTSAAALSVTAAQRGSLVTVAGGGRTDTISADELLIATGRTPNVEDLGLAAAGVEYARDAGISVDARLRTTNHRIFAVGDVNGGMQFTHAADAQARAVIGNALFRGRSKVDARLIPWCTYTSPELAHIGVTDEERKRVGDRLTTITMPMSAADRARTDGDDEGFLRLHVERNGMIAGATLVAEHAGEIIG